MARESPRGGVRTGVQRLSFYHPEGGANACRAREAHCSEPLRRNGFRAQGASDETTTRTDRTSSDWSVSFAFSATSFARNLTCAPQAADDAATTRAPPSRLTGAVSWASLGPTTSSQDRARWPSESPFRILGWERSCRITAPIRVPESSGRSPRPDPATFPLPPLGPLGDLPLVRHRQQDLPSTGQGL